MKKSICLTAVAALALASCSQDDLMDNGISGDNGNAIVFESYLGKSAQSRATVITTESLQKEGFTVDAYYTGTEDFGPEATGSVFMKGTKVTYNEGKAAWTYSPLKYWPNNTGDKVSFFAYGPYGNTNIKLNTDAVSSIDFTVQNNVLKQVDFIYNNQYDNSTINCNKPTVSEKVKFQFQHALSRIGFTVAAAVDETSVGTVKLDGNSRINVKKVALVNGDATSYTEGATGPFYEAGTLDMLNGNWGNLSGTQSFTLAGKEHFYRTVTDKDVENSTNDIDVVQLHKFNQSQRLLNDDSYLMIIPTDISENTDAKTSFKIYIEYDVITEDDDNADVSKITNKILSANALDVKFEAGKAYNFNLILGMTSVKFDVDEVVDWDNADSTDEWLPENESAAPVWDEESAAFLIYNATQLATMRDKINNDESYNTESRAGEKKYAEASYKQMADIDLSGFENWTPIGTSNSNPFKGKYDGLKHTIKRLKLNNSDENSYVGLFGYVQGAKIDNINITDCSMTGKYIGAIAGMSINSIIKDCTTSGTGTNVQFCGGIVSDNAANGEIIKCTNNISFTGDEGIGGICYSNTYRIAACVNNAGISGTLLVGGITSYSTGAIIACYNVGNINNTGNCCGGIVACTDGSSPTIIASYSKGTVQKTYNSGGIMGGLLNNTVIDNCYYFNERSDVPGIGSVNGGTDNTVRISNDDWSEAMNAMNLALARQHQNASEIYKEFYNWKYIDGDGSAPLELESGCVEKALLGKGTESDPYQIHDAADLKLMADLINNKTSARANCVAYDSVDAYYKQMENIDFNDAEWGDLLFGLIKNFYGNFDGCNFEIQNFKINYKRGLIATNYGTVKNVRLTNGSMSSPLDGVFGDNNGTIINCSFAGTVEEPSVYTGTIVGNNKKEGKLIGCSFNGTFTAINLVNGALCGTNYGIVAGCYSSGKISITSYDASNKCGGIVGNNDNYYNSAAVIGCYTTAEFETKAGKLYPITANDKGGSMSFNYHKAITSENSQLSDDRSIEIDGTTVTWASAVEAMNEAISEALNNLDCGNFKYVENTDDATKEAFPYILVESTTDNE